jgi:hypothetical protein
MLLLLVSASSWCCIFMVHLHGAASSWCIFMVYLCSIIFFLKMYPYLIYGQSIFAARSAQPTPTPSAQRGAGCSLDSIQKKKKKNGLDGTNLPSPNQKTSRTFTPKALHPNRTNG